MALIWPRTIPQFIDQHELTDALTRFNEPLPWEIDDENLFWSDVHE